MSDFDHKQELRDCIKSAVLNMLETMRGAQAFGSGVEVYENKRNDLVIRTKAGKVFLVKVQKSAWEFKS